MKIIILGCLSGVVLLTSCDDGGADYQSGYSDGYAEGYNTQCQIRATIVKADWDNADYSRGYNEGRNAGVSDCMASRR